MAGIRSELVTALSRDEGFRSLAGDYLDRVEKDPPESGGAEPLDRLLQDLKNHPAVTRLGVSNMEFSLALRRCRRTGTAAPK